MSSISNKQAGALLRGTHGLTEAVMNGIQGAEEVIASLADVATVSSLPDAELGALNKVLHRVLTDVQAGRLSSDRFITALNGLTEVASPVSSTTSIKPATKVEATSCVVTVDYGRRLVEAIWACHFKRYVNPLITSEHFRPVRRGTREVEIYLVNMHGRAKTEQVIARLEAENMRAADLWEILAFAECNPNVRHGPSIVGLGSVVEIPNGMICAPYIIDDEQGRDLSLRQIKDVWRKKSRFAAVRMDA